MQMVHIAETSTDKVPNASPTAASASSDLYGAAILDACKQLKTRLAPVYVTLGQGASMAAVAGEAWMRRIDLCAHGFYVTPDITGADGSRPFNYFVYGAAVAEVEVDCLTGDWRCTRADIAMDVGNPINPSIDIGQVEGGFVQVRNRFMSPAIV
jgi:xanthine dehydrogenase/oxidase